MKKIVLFTWFAFTCSQFLSQNQVNTKFGKGLYNVISKDSSWSMKLAARFQTQYLGEWTISDSNGIGSGSSQFLVRRARLKFDGFAYSPKLVYKIELGLSNRDLGKVSSRTNFAPRMILDAVLKWNFAGNFVLWAGQTKLPGNRERVISSANLQLVDRSLLNSRFTIDRDMGMQLRHHFYIGDNFLVREMISVAQGEGRNLVQSNLGGYQYTGRVEVLPFGKFAGKGDYIGGDLKREQKPKLSVAASYDFNDRAVKDRSNQGSYMSYDLDNDEIIDGYFESNTHTLFVDAMFKYKGFSLMGEYANRTSNKEQQTIVNLDSTSTTKTVYTGSGLNIQMGYVTENNWEIAGRYTQINPSNITSKSTHTQYTLGLSKYVVGHKLKVQSDVSYLVTEGNSDNDLIYRLQFELHF